MNRPRRFDDEHDDQAGPAQQHGASSGGPPEHPGIGQAYRASDAGDALHSQGAPVYPPEEPHTSEPGGFDPRHATWSTAPDPAVDSYGQTSERSFNAPDDAVDAEVVAPAAPAKRRKGPILIFGAVFGVALVAVVVSMLRVMTGGSDRGAQDMAMTAPAMPVATATPPAPDPALQSTPQATAGAAPGAPGAPDAAAAQAAQAAQASALAAPTLPPVAAVPGVTTPVAQVAAQPAAQPAAPLTGAAAAAGAPQTAEVKALQKTIEDLKGRIDTMSKEMATLREQRSRQAAESVGQKKSDKPAPVRSAAKVEKPTNAQAAAQRKGSPGEDAAGTVTARSSAVAAAPAIQSEPMQGFNLRAVFPPTGADMQAWVMEGEILRVVSRGSTIAGHRVLDVLPDRVVTDSGVIR